MSSLAPTPEHSAYPPQPLHDYAFLADGERGALLGPRGEICWLCAPRWHNEAVFSTLIGGRGIYAVTPKEPFVPGGSYDDGSLIWRSRWVTQSGIVESREALAFPGEPDRLVLLRRVLAREGPARVHVVMRPLAAYDREPLRDIRQDDEGAWTARLGELCLRWTGGRTARLTNTGSRAGQLTMDLTLDAGDWHDLVLEVSTSPLAMPPVDPSAAWADTERAWQAAVPVLETIAGRDARQAYAVLRGMTSASGGMVAAATTSLPERAEEGRNYDYRYVWIRDQCLAGQAVAATGNQPLLGDAVRFVEARLHTDGPEMMPAYTVTGGAVPDQRELDLPGYPGGYDRIGNHVNRQFQLDAFGEALLLFSAAARLDQLDRDGWQAADIAADTIRRRWHEPDAGIWELNNRTWTHSRLICVAGLRKMAGAAAPGPKTREWSDLAGAILADTEASALHPEGHWQRSPDDPAVDAALLLPGLRGMLPPDDPRTQNTLRAYLKELACSHYAYRFRHNDRPLPEAEGAFLLCGFVTALAEHQQGNEVEAYRWFERNRDACGAAGLYSEEYDIAQRRLRGNMPQAFVHALMLEAAAMLAKRGAH
ncbi:glycoside hydrolase family 15 protein [Streptomyces halobius]|uniref:Glycoside hydrolase family 15 protein n=1 Tax=Streptomyces halobius TaxID=2879846 RepID=A0ABY4LYS6_9ACTN|nr:glycoside hydrolase family 15 protein [Streptomyces halobius]UQA90664.1 glycoside hydrolase family 15 protein [Streptomyces halobius]